MPVAEDKATVREAILDGIERLLARYGYKKTTMDDLAREAGIGKGTIYLYFPSKEEVALCSIDRVVERVQERLRTIAATGGPAGQRLRQMLIERVLIRIDNVRAYSECLDDLFESLRLRTWPGEASISPTRRLCSHAFYWKAAAWGSSLSVKLGRRHTHCCSLPIRCCRTA